MDTVQRKADFERNILENQLQVKDSYFPTDRGIRRRTKMIPSKYRTSYLSVFGPTFLERLKGMSPEDTWLNIGGGELYAEAEYLTLPEFRDMDHSKICVVSAASPDTQGFHNNLEFLKKSLGNRFQYIDNCMIENIPTSQLEKAALITDLYAAMGFTPYVDVTMQKELDFLSLGGYLFTTMDKVFIEDKEGKKIGRRSYISSIQGIQLMPKSTRFSPIIIEMLEENLSVPRLELVKFLSYKNAENPKGLPEIMPNCERYYVKL